MNIQENINYYRIAEAIDFIRSNFKQQPGLDEVAEKLPIGRELVRKSSFNISVLNMRKKF
jgi:hypothetical protein